MAVNKNVTVIPARKHTRKSEDEEKPKLRVAAYCRVSTDSDEQATSYDTQIEHYTAYIQGHPDWVLAGIYADDYAIIGLSGRNLDISRGLELGPIIFLPSFLLFHLKVKIHSER